MNSNERVLLMTNIAAWQHLKVFLKTQSLDFVLNLHTAFNKYFLLFDTKLSKF